MIPAKILLFGEHILIKGAEALVIPFPTYGGVWKYAPDAADKQFHLYELADFLEKSDLWADFAVDKFREDLDRGLFFSSTIPTGYGLGSSGAVTAAVFEKYCVLPKSNESENLTMLKTVLAGIESYFHGTSSGIDPLICYLQKPLHLKSKSNIEPVSPSFLSRITLFLLDTKTKRSTQPLVQSFLRNWERDQQVLMQDLFPANKAAIKAYLNGDARAFKSQFSKISEIQFSFFKPMILPEFEPIWREGLKGNLYKFKLCGAGGGGFILGMTEDFAETQEALSSYKILKINN